MRRPLLLDLFSCAGGAAMGYAEAGFQVIGVDIDPQPRYPKQFGFIRADVLSLDQRFLRQFDAIHASPPCQGYTDMVAPGQVGAPQLIDPVREMLIRSGRPWVIENVEGAAWAMRNPVLLCGSMFDLGTQGHQLQRHRLFEASFPLIVPDCQHTDEPVVGVYGGHARCRSAKHGGRGTKDVWDGGHKAAASEALGIDWATLNELSEAIPPAYTRFIGAQLMAQVRDLELVG